MKVVQCPCLALVAVFFARLAVEHSDWNHLMWTAQGFELYGADGVLFRRRYAVDAEDFEVLRYKLGARSRRRDVVATVGVGHGRFLTLMHTNEVVGFCWLRELQIDRTTNILYSTIKR